MHQILKRLELIKTSIAIEDVEIIELQIGKLSGLDGEVANILQMLKNQDYGLAVVAIESYLAQYSGMVVYEDKEINGLKLQLKVLEQKLQQLSEDKNEYLHEIHEFHVAYHVHLGSLIGAILKCKQEIKYQQVRQKQEAFEALAKEYKDLKKQKEKLQKKLDATHEFDDEYDKLYEELQELEAELNQKRKETKEAKEEFEENEQTKEYEEAKEDFEEFYSEYEKIQKEDRFELDEAQQKELKTLFRKAMKLCHPDIVADSFKAEANRIAQELNEANSKKDLKRIQKILHDLENGIIFVVASDAITNKEVLKEKIKDIQEKLTLMNYEIETLKEDDLFVILEEFKTLEEYFEIMQVELQKQLEDLQEELETNQENF